MRKLGIGAIGLIGGLLLGLIGRLFVPEDAPVSLALAVGAITLGLAVGGVALALAIDSRYLKRRASKSPPEQSQPLG